MSTVLDKNYQALDESGVTIPAMPKGTQLGALISKVRQEKDLTYQDIAKASGGVVSPSYVHYLETLDDQTKVGRVGGNKILGLSKGLGESPVTVFLATIGRAGKNDATKDEAVKQMAEDYAALPARDRDELRLMIEMLRKEIYERRARAMSHQ